MIKVQLKDGSVREFEQGASVLDVANSISDGLARAITGAKLNGAVVGTGHQIEEDSKIEFLKFEDADGKDIFWHTSTHIMAHAIKNLFPEAKLGTGPAVENGFYYDIDLDYRLTPEDLEKIEAEMKKIVKDELEIERFELDEEAAVALMKERNEDYKIELIHDLSKEGQRLSFYRQGDFVDLCAGPHLSNTKKVKAFKLTSVAGAYWRADQSNKMLQRVYGISFEKKKLHQKPKGKLWDDSVKAVEKFENGVRVKGLESAHFYHTDYISRLYSRFKCR